MGRDRLTTCEFLNALTVLAHRPLALFLEQGRLDWRFRDLRPRVHTSFGAIMRPPSVPKGHEKRIRIGMIRCGVYPNIATNLTWRRCGRI